MDGSHRRPIPIWIALIILAIYVPLLVGGFFLAPLDESVLDAPEFADLIIDHVETASVVLSLAIAFWALARRRQWGRSFVVASLAYIIGALGYGQIFLAELNQDEQGNILLGAGIFLSPLFLAVLLVSFGEDAKSYFSGGSANESE